MSQVRRILFEPWALGDALIAASLLKMRPDFELACSEKWHPVLRSVFDDAELRLSVGDAAYASRSRNSPVESKANPGGPAGEVEVFSIRGDPRDYRLAKKLYPGAKIHMSGWLPFLLWHVRWLDAVYRAGPFKVTNRYDLWCRLLKVNRADFETHFYQSDSIQIQNRKVLIHVGAQWKSRQYPFVPELIQELSDTGFTVRAARAPGESAPKGLHEVEELVDDRLVQAMRDSDFVIANDSGPFHLAAILGRPVFCIGRVSNLAYWTPPGAFLIASENMPTGYAPKNDYCSDEPGEDWPSAKRVISIIRKHVSL